MGNDYGTDVEFAVFCGLLLTVFIAIGFVCELYFERRKP
jgi:hypothetical protein